MKKWTKPAIDLMLKLYADHTYPEIAKKLEKKFKVKYTSNAVRKAHERYMLEPKKISNRPKILIFDIETAPMEVYAWGLWKQNIGLNQIIKDITVLSWAAKWYDEDVVMYEDVSDRKDVRDDKKILKSIWKLLDEADVVVTQNGRRFDQKKLFSRFIQSGMKPPSSFRHVDTLIIAKKHFGFTSNKLEFMTDKLCTKNKKLKHAKYPGFALWKACLNGDKEAWAEMKEYNEMDVLSLEELYDKLIPWDDSITYGLYSEEYSCTCGSTSFRENGYYYTNASKYQRYECTSCGKEYRDKKNLKGTAKRLTNKRG